MARLLPSLRGESEEAEPTPRKGLRKAALGLGLVALAYVASRRAGSGEIAPGELREKASGALPTVEPESGAEIVKRMQGGDGDGAAGAEPIAKYLSGGERSGEERFDEEIEGRAEENAQEEPAEPGEMHVDDDIVDEVVDGDEESE